MAAITYQPAVRVALRAKDLLSSTAQATAAVQPGGTVQPGGAAHTGGTTSAGRKGNGAAQ
jgi:hypothetical protein